MEISMMVAQLKTEAKTIEDKLDSKRKEETALRLSLAGVEQEIKDLNTKRDAVNAAINNLRSVCPKTQEIGGAYAIRPAAKHKSHSTKPRMIGKFDADGNKIGEFRSISEAAKTFGWGNTPMRKYIESENREKQIRLRGFYLAFIAA